MNLTTKRLTLRPWLKSDATSLYSFAKDPFVGPAAGWPIHTSVSDSLQIIQNVLAKDESYAITLVEEDQAIGSIGLMIGKDANLALPENEAEVGYWIGVPYWGQGLVSEALKEIMQHAFVDLKMQSLWCGYYEGNIKSKRVQEKCGFVYHHTIDAVNCSLLHEIRKEHVSCITKEQWENNQDMIA
ncbi:MAG: GNAT family N-acetyltransferase [Longicatena sp.]